MLTRYFLLLSVLFVAAACSSTEETPLVDGLPEMQREAITTDATVAVSGEDGLAAGETVNVYSEDMSSPEASQMYLEQTIGDRVFFGYDSSSLTNEARQTLLAQAKWLQRFPRLQITVEGHCDERGTREYNLALGERRASAAKNYLVALGIDSSRITVVSYGKERPAVPGSNESAWAQNRRSVSVIQ